MLLLLCSLLLGLLLGLVVTLDDDEVVVAVRSYHHIVDFAGHPQEGQIVLGVQVAHQTPSSYCQLRKPHRVLGCFFTLAHRGSYDLGGLLAALLRLRFLDNNKALNTLVRLDPRDSVLDFALDQHSGVRRIGLARLTVILGLTSHFLNY